MGKSPEKTELSKNQVKAIKDMAERQFALCVLAAGLKIAYGPSIRCNPPVPDKNGDQKKVVTKPDFLVIDPPTKREAFVEVTHGNGDAASKEAQRRVVAQAGITNYYLVTGNSVALLVTLPNNQKRTRLNVLLKWD